MGKAYYSKKMLLGSLVAGAIYAGLGEIIYTYLNNVLLRFVVTALYFICFFLFLGVVLWVLTLEERKGCNSKFNGKQWLQAFVILLVAAAIFELIYDIEIHKEQQDVTSYIFVIDNSGSMNINDPSGMRYQVLEDLLAEKSDHFEYALYTFSDEAVLYRKMQPKSISYYDRDIRNGGGTAINSTLRKIIGDIENGTLVCQKGCRMIFLSDGCATDSSGFFYSRYKSVLRQYQQNGISISTVGIGNADKRLMQLLADRTGGVYVHIDNLDELESAMEQAGTRKGEKRNLLGIRQYGSIDWLLASLRMLFMAVLGCIIGVQKVLICDVYFRTQSVIKSSVIGCILAGIFLELSIEVFIWPLWLCHMVMCILMAFVLVQNNYVFQRDDRVAVNVRKSI